MYNSSEWNCMMIENYSPDDLQIIILYSVFQMINEKVEMAKCPTVL